MDLSDFETPSISPLRLAKVQYVVISDLFFYQQWTNKCTQLKLSGVMYISKEWCKFVIENCDCSNITSLTLHRVMFDDVSMMILKQLALKFNSLQTLEIVFLFDVKSDELLFLQSLKPIISRNKTKVQLQVDEFINEYQYSLLSETMHEKDVEIDKLIISGKNHFIYLVNSTIKLIQERDNRGLNHFVIANQISDNATQKLLHELKCKSITTFELKGCNIEKNKYLLLLMFGDITAVMIIVSKFYLYLNNCIKIYVNYYLCNKSHLILK